MVKHSRWFPVVGVASLAIASSLLSGEATAAACPSLGQTDYAGDCSPVGRREGRCLYNVAQQRVWVDGQPAITYDQHRFLGGQWVYQGRKVMLCSNWN